MDKTQAKSNNRGQKLYTPIVGFEVVFFHSGCYNSVNMESAKYFKET